MNKENHEIEIDLAQLVRTLWQKAKYIVLVTVIFGILGMVASVNLITPIYEASGKMIVNTRKDDNTSVSNDQLNSAKNLVDTYAIVIRSRDVVNQVIADLGLDISYGELAGCISVKAVNNTQIMRIVVQHADRNLAIAVAEKLLDVAPDVIEEVVAAGSVKPVEQVYSSTAPVSPNNVKNAVFAAMLGFALACGLIVVLYLADNTYKSDIEIQNDLGLIVLGVIPKVESCRRHAKHGYYGYYGYGQKTEERK
ncbi:MAG: capsular biosynthesis protein [Oscillospiraceae bacterium]|nr:capsular biosynthesis protein [Oscillospiraceae bacterium]